MEPVVAPFVPFIQMQSEEDFALDLIRFFRFQEPSEVASDGTVPKTVHEASVGSFP